MAEKYLANYRLRLVTCNFLQPGYTCIYVIFSIDNILVYIIDACHKCGKGPQHLLWVGSQAACGEITVSGITDCQYTVISITDCQITASGITDCQITVSYITDCKIRVSGITDFQNYFINFIAYT